MKHGIQKTSTLEITMREYALTLAQPTLSSALIPLAVQCIKTVWMRRKIRTALLSIGTRPALGLPDADLRRLLMLPISCDLTIEMERIKFLAARHPHDHASAELVIPTMQ